MPYTYRGVTTHQLYRFDTPQLSPPADTVVLNGEVCVEVNNDGAIERGHASGPAPDDPYGIGVTPSTWERL